MEALALEEIKIAVHVRRCGSANRTYILYCRGLSLSKDIVQQSTRLDVRGLGVLYHNGFRACHPGRSEIGINLAFSRP